MLKAVVSHSPTFQGYYYAYSHKATVCGLWTWVHNCLPKNANRSEEIVPSWQNRFPLRHHPFVYWLFEEDDNASCCYMVPTKKLCGNNGYFPVLGGIWYVQKKSKISKCASSSSRARRLISNCDSRCQNSKFFLVWEETSLKTWTKTVDILGSHRNCNLGAGFNIVPIRCNVRAWDLKINLWIFSYYITCFIVFLTANFFNRHR